MTNKPGTYEFPWYFKAAAVLLMLTLTIYGMIVAKAIVVPFLFALFFAVLLSPLCGLLESWRFPKVLAALTSLLLGIAVVALGIMFFYSQLAGFVEDSEQIQRRVSELFNDLYALLGPYVDAGPEEYLENIEASIIEFIRGNFDSLTKGVMTAATTITLAFIVPVYVVLLLIFRGFLKEFLIRAFSTDDTEKVKRLINKVKHVVQYYILGMLMVIFILAILNSTLLLVLGVNHAIFFGVFAAFLNIIPFVGPLVGSILPILYALLTTDSLLIPALVLLGFYVIQLFESNLFTPSIVGRQVSLNPLVTLLAIFIGAQIWGLAGMILFIPVGAVLKVIFDEVDSLKPLGFLLGKADLREKGTGPIAQKVREISEKINPPETQEHDIEEDHSKKESSTKK